MKRSRPKILAVLEVFTVVFLLRTGLTVGINRLFPRFLSWQTDRIGFDFPVHAHVVMMVIALAAALLWRKKPSEWGLSLTPPGYHLDIAGTCFLPVVLSNMVFALGIDYKQWQGALILAPVQLALLFGLAQVLRKKPAASAWGSLAGASALILVPVSTELPSLGKAIALFLTYALFVGFGEEMIYRGYMQSRLNEAFGKPFHWMGVAFGWGAVITALLFGLSHTGLVGWALGLSSEITLAWGFWTVFGGLVYGFVREKSGSILAPALLHGLPQAIALVAMLYL